ncbi:MAG TPA: hypothetical protein VFD27_21175, partial [Chthoniobacteraceae bacterium]|nr:hypothetical protein [Chthoniobacteraceae bacterium]
VKAGADYEKGKIVDTIGAKTGADGAGEIEESGQFHDRAREGERKSAAVSDSGQKIATKDSAHFVEEARHG